MHVPPAGPAEPTETRFIAPDRAAWRSVACALVLFAGCATARPQSHEPQRRDVEFQSGQEVVRGWLYLPAGNESKLRSPGVVMAPGFSGTKETNYQFFAEAFAQAGLAVLLIDYPGFGASGGALRGEVDPALQVQTYRDGLSFLAAQEEVDPGRLGLWGGSYSGGHVLVAAAQDPRVKCLVAMTPFLSGGFYLSRMPPEQRALLEQQFAGDREARARGVAPAMIPVATEDGEGLSAIASPNAWRFIQSFQSYAPSYVNAVTLRSLELELAYEPRVSVPTIGAIPKLFIIARGDELIPEALIQDAFQAATEPKQLAYLEGHHFTPYMEGRAEAIRLAAEWFVKNLK
ncbi:MAG: alpha/beta fold hydrolase [Myxococcota bacterium]